MSGIEQAAAFCGSQSGLARALGVTPQYISLSIKKGFISPKYAAEIEHLTGVDRRSLVDPKLLRMIAA